MSVTLAFSAFLVLLLSTHDVSAQELSRSAKDGIGLVNEKQYRFAIKYLEDAREERPDEPTVHEYLAMAYIYSANGPDQQVMKDNAASAARRAVDLGGCAMFLVDRSLEGWSASAVLKVERGRLRFCKDRLEYKAERADTAFRATPPEINEFAYNSRKGKDKSTFHIHVKEKSGTTKHDFRPASFTEKEPDLLFELIEEYWQLRQK